MGALKVLSALVIPPMEGQSKGDNRERHNSLYFRLVKAIAALNDWCYKNIVLLLQFMFTV